MLIKIHYDTRIIDIIRVNCREDIFTVSTCLDVCILNIIISGFFNRFSEVNNIRIYIYYDYDDFSIYRYLFFHLYT